MAGYIIQLFKVFPNVKENGRKSMIKISVHCGNNFMTNICDSDIASPKLEAVSLVCKISLINNENIICTLCLNTRFMYMYIWILVQQIANHLVTNLKIFVIRGVFLKAWGQKEMSALGEPS